jgi:hypothetical protein
MLVTPSRCRRHPEAASEPAGQNAHGRARLVQTHQTKSTIERRVISVLVATALLVSGIGIGLLGSNSTVPQHAHIAGACVALEMAGAHLLLDDTDKVLVLHAVLSPANPYWSWFRESRKSAAQVCEAIRLRRDLPITLMR